MRALALLLLVAGGAVAQHDPAQLVLALGAESSAVRDDAEARLVALGPAALEVVRRKAFEAGLELDLAARLTRIERSLAWQRDWDAGGVEIVRTALTQPLWAVNPEPLLRDEWSRWFPDVRLFRVAFTALPLGSGLFGLPYHWRAVPILAVRRHPGDAGYGFPSEWMSRPADPDQATEAALAVAGLLDAVDPIVDFRLPDDPSPSQDVLVAVLPRTAGGWTVLVERPGRARVVTFGPGGNLVSVERSRAK